MPSSYTPLLRLTLPADGELVGTWGQTVNNGITSLEEAAIAGTAVVPVTDGVDTVLTTANGAADQARANTLRLTGVLTAQRNVVCPAVSKNYFVRNATTGGFGVQVKTPAGTGIVVPAGQAKLVYCDGVNVVEAISGSGAFVLKSGDTMTGNLNIFAPAGSLNITAVAGSPAGVEIAGNGNTILATSLFVGQGSSSDAYIYQRANAAMLFGTGGIERMRIDANGNVFVGNTSISTYSANTASLIGADSTRLWTAVSARSFNNSVPASAGALVLGRSRGATVGALSTTVLDDYLGLVSAEGVNTGNTAVAGGFIGFLQDGAAGAAFIPGRIVFSTGTNAAAPVERARISAAGFVGIGTTNPQGPLDIGGSASGAQQAFLTTQPGSNYRLIAYNGVAGASVLAAAFGLVNAGVGDAAMLKFYRGVGLVDAAIAFDTLQSERMRILSTGNILFGVSVFDVTLGGVVISPGATSTVYHGHAAGSANASLYENFFYAGTSIGSITQDGTIGVKYNTGSDRRLKNDIEDLGEVGHFIDSLRPRTWYWKDGTPGVGFVADEIMEVSPSSVTGTPDAVDDDGDPVYQQMSYSSPELIACLVAEVKSLRRRVAGLGG